MFHKSNGKLLPVCYWDKNEWICLVNLAKMVTIQTAER